MADFATGGQSGALPNKDLMAHTLPYSQKKLPERVGSSSFKECLPLRVATTRNRCNADILPRKTEL